MNASGGYIERTYSTALFELAECSGAFDAVKDDLDSWIEICGEEKDFQELIISPYFSSQYKQQLVRKIFSGKISDLTLNFLIVAIRHNRTRFLSQIMEEYNRLWDVRQGRCSVQVTVATKISDDEAARISNDIASSIDRKVKINIAINPDIIGGIIIRYDDKVIDNTVRTRLNKTVETILNRGKRRKIDEV